MATVARLQTAADLSASQIAGAISPLMPTGVVLPYAGTSAPSGWLACNGDSISRTAYAALFTAIGTAHGTVDGTSFNLPDYRGRFIRGTDAMFGGSAAGRDPNSGTRTFAATGGNIGNAVGSVQTNATARPTTAFSGTSGNTNLAHTHVQNDYTVGAGGAVIGARGDSYAGGSLVNTNVPTQAASVSMDHSHSLSITTGGDSETRPLNAYVNYIIKI